MKKFLLYITILILTSCLAILSISYSQKYLYRLLPNDYNRHIEITDVLTNNLKLPNILIFGDSRSMSGVDAGIIKKSLNFNGEVYNLSSPAQQLFESSYYYSYTDSTTAIIIQCVSHSFFSKDEKHYLGDNLALSMFLGGYRINDETKNLIKNYNHTFDRAPIVNYIRSRPIFKSYFHNLLRPLIDNEMFDESARKSVYFPHVYITDKQPGYNKIVKQNCEAFKVTENQSSKLSFLSKVDNYFKVKDIGYLLVMMPINPDQCNGQYDELSSYSRYIEEVTNVDVLDLSGLIPDGKYFYDAGHPNKAGALIVSNAIAEELKQLLEDSEGLSILEH